MTKRLLLGKRGLKLKHILIRLRFEETGRTLIEILASVVLLAIIVIPFASIFVQSSKTISVSDTMIDATYVAQSEMERFYDFSRDNSISYENLVNGYSKREDSITGREYSYEKQHEGYYVLVELDSKDNDLVNVLVKIFNNSSMDKLEAQMETIYLWEE